MGPLVLLYHLASKHKMNISMFERLIKNNCNRIVLNCQHRINSSISWVYNHFYTKQIHDHVSVTSPVKLNGLVTSDVWANLIQEAKDRQIYGNGIPLTCHKHPDNNIVARTGKDSEGEEFNDFDKRPDGGCQIACGRGLRCGHTCPKKCHSDDDSHTIVKCTKVCSKDVNCAFNQQNEIKHKCKQTCGHEGDCNICLEKIPKHMSECGNDIMFACSKEPKKSDCLSNCKKNFSVRT